MWLRVHNLTDYYKDYAGVESVHDEVFKIDLYAAFAPGMIDPERSCNNLMQVNATSFMMICKSTAKYKFKTIASTIIVNLIDLEKKLVTYTSALGAHIYEDQRDGTMIKFKADPENRNDYRFWYLVKENATQCNIQMFEHTIKSPMS